MEHDTTIRDGLPVLIRVTTHHPSRPMAVTGTGFGDADPPEPEELEWVVEDPRRPGVKDRWRAGLITPADEERISAEILEAMENENAC